MRRGFAAALVGLAIAMLPASAAAEYEIDPASAKVELLNASGEAETRAGAHPDRMITKFKFTLTPGIGTEANASDIAFDLPVGMSGNPAATPRCSRALFAEGVCPAETQVGVLRGTFAGFGELELNMYNVEPGPNELAEVGFTAILVPVRFVISLRGSDYGMRLEANDLTQELPMRQAEIELWGVPADHQSGTPIPRRPFLTTPTRCDGATAAALKVRTWQRPETWMTTPLPLPAFDACDGLPFAPALGVTTSSDRADSPTGLSVSLGIPQDEDPDRRSASQVRSVSVTLPPGFSLSPGVAQGLDPCSDAQLGLGDPGPARCPDAAKLGTVEIASPAAAGPIDGSVFLGAPTAADPYRLFLVAEAAGVTIKLPGVLRAEQRSGRLTTVLTELPQLPVSGLALTFRDGPRAPLASPARCTTGLASAELVPYDGAPAQTASTAVTTGSEPDGSPCRTGDPFAPSFVAGSTSPRAGAEAAFSATIRRGDGEAEIERLRMTLPAGLVARLAGVERCSDGALAAGACPAGSRIGSTLVEAGAGPAPLAVGGGVYLTGPYRGAPFGLALILHARVGPLDLGVAAVRAALLTDPATARLTIATDPLPEVLGGVPLRLRAVGIDIDRPGFIRNPTSCAPQRVDAVVTSVDGASTLPSVPFRVGRCGKLRVRPNLSLALLGARSKRPALRVRLRPSERAANLRSVAIKLPKLLELDDSALIACALEQFRRDECPAASRVGSASASTPLLSGGLRGPVRLVQASDIGPPEVWTTLRGEGMRLTTRSTIGISTGGQLLDSLEALPDVPLRTLTTTLHGGTGSLIVPKRPPCAVGANDLLAEASARAHSGAQLIRVLRVGLRPACHDGR
jgi:hypothetical protein